MQTIKLNQAGIYQLREAVRNLVTPEMFAALTDANFASFISYSTSHWARTGELRVDVTGRMSRDGEFHSFYLADYCYDIVDA
jgi:hypothetical protein